MRIKGTLDDIKQTMSGWPTGNYTFKQYKTCCHISQHVVIHSMQSLHTYTQTCQVSRNFRESPEMARDLQVSRNCKEIYPPPTESRRLLEITKQFRYYAPPPNESRRLLEITEKTQEIQQAQLGSSANHASSTRNSSRCAPEIHGRIPCGETQRNVLGRIVHCPQT